MVTNYSQNNYILLVGQVTSEKKFSHEIYGESFFNFDLEIPRLSGISDIIPITISERLIANFDLSIGKKVVIEGQFRSYNTYENSRSRLILTVFVKEIRERGEFEEIKIPNEVQLVGHICRKPIYRKTPFGREIADILVAVNRAYNKSDYIPCITWGRNARFCEDMPIGTEVKLVGRVQSRPYEKKHDDGTVEARTAYEVSISSLEFVNKDEDKNALIEENSTTEEAM